MKGNIVLLATLAILAVVAFNAAAALKTCAYTILRRDNAGSCCRNNIVDMHNKYRTMALNGAIPNQPRAKWMNMLQWDNDLATKAQQVADTCDFNHVKINSSTYGWVGQNLYQTWGSSPDLTIDYKGAVDTWYNEYKVYHYPDSSSHLTGHYTQLVWANTQKVGCACTIYKKGSDTYKYYVCNYGPGGNYQGQRPYEAK